MSDLGARALILSVIWASVGLALGGGIIDAAQPGRNAHHGGVFYVHGRDSGVAGGLVNEMAQAIQPGI